MKAFFAANIMRTAIGVVLLSILPAMLVVAGAGVARHNDDREAAALRRERLVHSLALRQERMTQAMEAFVRTLGRLRDVREADMTAASTSLHTLLKASAGYANIFLLDSAGNVLASALPEWREHVFSRSLVVTEALSRRALSGGETAISPVTGEPVLFFAAPVALNGMANSGVVCVAADLSRHAEDIARPQPDNAAVFLVDAAGRVVAAPPGAGLAAAGDTLEGPLWDAVRLAEAPSGRTTVRGGGHLPEYDVLYQRLSLPRNGSPYLFILSVRPARPAHAYAGDAPYRHAGVFAVVVLLAVGLATGLCYLTVRRPWRALLGAAARVGGGEIGVRVPVNGVGGEIGMLSREFNAMADSLDKREADIAAAWRQAEHSRVAKSEFLANMSHEIRTSMNAILGMAYLVLKTDLTARQRGYISKLLAAANALLRVINDILDFSKIEAGKMVMENISFSLRRILGSIRSEVAARLSDKQLGFDLQISHGVPDHLIGDPLRLGQALMVLIDDAVSRSERGVLSLSCSVTERDANQLTLRFAVRDAGVGLTPAQLAAMRELFANEPAGALETLDKARLRFAIANRLFRMMRGRVDVASVFGEGVLFTATAGFGYAAPELSRPDRLFEGKKALVVDADEVSRQDLVDVLMLFGFTVECVSGFSQAQEALGNARKNNSPFAIIFMDWRPSSTGMASRIAQLRGGDTPLPPLVLTTAPGRATLPVSLGELAIDALLPKPINESLVFDTIMNLLEVRRGVSALPPEESGPEKTDFAGCAILLAEDNAVNQQIAREILESEGIRVTCADNGEDAVTLLRESAPDAFDLVLMDLQMPVMDGFAATRAIRSMDVFHPLRLPIIAMTAHSGVTEIAACFDAGMNDHTGKPVIIDKLLATIRYWLPPRAEDAAGLAETASLLRALAGGEDAASRRRMEALLAKATPSLHEGRTGVLRAALLAGDAETARQALAALDALVAKPAGGGDRA